jgi:hypothetical protein
MTIDIHPGDTFTIWTNGAILQYRNDTTRWLGDDVWATGSTSRCHDERELCPATARQIILAAGHTITEAQPQPTPVPWPTHAVVKKTDPNLIAWTGSIDACNDHVRGCEANYEVRPLAPAPPSPKMREFIEAFEVYANRNLPDSVKPGSIERKLLDATRALLAEGGAA